MSGYLVFVPRRIKDIPIEIPGPSAVEPRFSTVFLKFPDYYTLRPVPKGSDSTHKLRWSHLELEDHLGQAFRKTREWRK